MLKEILRMKKITRLEKSLKDSTGYIKLINLVQLSEAYLNSNPEKSIEVGTKAVRLAVRLKKTKEKAQAQYIIGKAFNDLDKPDKAIKNISDAANEFRLILDQDGICETAIDLGLINETLNDFPTSLAHFEKAIGIGEKTSNNRIIASAALGIGRIHGKLANFGKSLEYLIKAKREFENIGDKLNTANVTSNIGNVYSILNNSKAALEYHAKALEIGKSVVDEFTIAKYYNNIGVDYGDIGDFNKAIKFHTKALKLREKLGEKIEVIISLNNLGVIKENQEEYSDALKYFKNALKELGSLQNKQIRISILHNIATSSIKLGKHDNALKFLNESLELANELNAVDELKDIYMAFSELFSDTGDYKSALEYHIKFSKLQTEIYNDEVRDKIAEMQVINEIEKREQENLLLRQKLNYQNKELASLARNVAQKNELINKLREEIQATEGKSSERGKSELDIMDLKSIFNTSQDWIQFKKQFENVYPDFLSQLAKKYPALTRQELRICSLVKVKLSTPMIAKVLFISKRSVENHRYRLRKKLNLPTNQELPEFLDSISF